MTAAFTLLAVVLLLGGILFILIVSLAARVILRPPRMTDGKAIHRMHRLSPGDLGLAFENASFQVRDKRSGKSLHIAGWWIPHPDANGRCVLLLHGYADAKVGAIAFAPLLHDLGWNILAIDLRAHGESAGRYCTGGYFEREDVTQVIDELLSTRPHDTRNLIIFGISLGAAVAAAAAASRNDLKGVILESPIADYRRAVAAHFDLLGLPRGLILRTALFLAETISGARFDDVRTVDTIPRIRRPVLAIVGSDDELLKAPDIDGLKNAMGQNPMVIIAGASHLQGMKEEPELYSASISQFLNRVMAEDHTHGLQTRATGSDLPPKSGTGL